MTTLDDLAAAAEKALGIDEGDWFGPDVDYIDTTDTSALRYIAAADPTTVLRLVAVYRAAQEAKSILEHTSDRHATDARLTLLPALAALEEVR